MRVLTEQSSPAPRAPALVRAATRVLAAQAAATGLGTPVRAEAGDAVAGRGVPCSADAARIVATHPQAGPAVFCTARRCEAICRAAEAAGGACAARPATGTYVVQLAGWLVGCRAGANG